MLKRPFTIDLLIDLLKRVPEGYLSWQQIQNHFDLKSIGGSWKALRKAASQSGLGFKELIVFDATRISWQAICQKQTWSSPQMPAVTDDGAVVGPTIQELVEVRKRYIEQLTDPDEIKAIQRLDQSKEGCLWLESFENIPDYQQVLTRLQEQNILSISTEFVFDPCRVTINPKLIAHLTSRKQREQEIPLAIATLASHATGIFSQLTSP